MRHSRHIWGPMAKILKGFDQKSKEALSRALTEELGLQTVLN